MLCNNGINNVIVKENNIPEYKIVLGMQNKTIRLMKW